MHIDFHSLLLHIIKYSRWGVIITIIKVQVELHEGYIRNKLERMFLEAHYWRLSQ